MIPQPRPIAPLPPRTASHLRSSIILPSLPSILTELIQNALDANATKIDTSIDLARWTVACHDNGHGIGWADLQQLGSERYLSSKLGGGQGGGGKAPGRGQTEIGLDGVNTFGFRGEAVASMCDVGMVEVLTRPGGGNGDSYELVMGLGTRGRVANPAKDRVRIGTSVWVRDIFAQVSCIDSDFTSKFLIACDPNFALSPGFAVPSPPPAALDPHRPRHPHRRPPPHSHNTRPRPPTRRLLPH